MATDDTFRERFLESNGRFLTAMLDAIRAHQTGVIAATAAFGKLDELIESVEELKGLIMEQGTQLREQGEQIRALRTQIDERGLT
jgi:hypothetical protein